MDDKGFSRINAPAKPDRIPESKPVIVLAIHRLPDCGIVTPHGDINRVNII